MQAVKRLGQLSTVSAGALALTIGTISGAQANSFVNFENAPSLGLGDNQSLTDQYLDWGFSFGLDNDMNGVADSGIGPVLEMIGSNGVDGFVNKGLGNDVAEEGYFDEDAGITYADRLGNYFLRTGGLGGDGGNLLISFTEGTSAASGELWDIDGNGTTRLEQWEVQALGTDGSILEKIISPLGEANNSDAQGFSLDGKPWMWSFQRDTADVSAIRFVYVGETNDIGNVGLAFDNFSAYSVEDSSASVPEPASTAGLIVLGLFGSGSWLSKRKG